MKRVCIDARLIRAPGIGTYLKNLLFHFKNTPWKWFALVHKNEEIPSYIEPIFVTSKIYSIQEQFELSLRIPSVDLFWSPHYNVPCLPIRARKRLASIHDAFHLAYAATLKPMERMYAQWMMKRAMRLSDQVITCSEFSREQIQEHLRIKRSITVIPYGVDGKAFNRDVVENQLLKKYGIDLPFVLYVGSLKAHKNVRGLIEAFSLLVKKGLRMQLVIVGGGQGMRYCEDVKQLCIAYPELQGRVCAVGHVPDSGLPLFYRQAEL